MSDDTFDIVFSGELAPGAESTQVKKNLAAMFKTEAGKVEPLFSGQRLVIKKGLDQATALKYQRALREAGALVEVVSVSAVRSAVEPSTAPVRSPSPAARTAAVALSLAPPGVTLVAPEVVTPLKVELGHLALDPPGVVLVPPSHVPDLEVNVAGMSMAEPGALLKQHEVVPDLRVDTAAMTMAERGVTLIEPTRVAPAVIDTSKIQLA